MRGSIEVHRYLTERQIPHEFYRLERPLRRLDEAAPLLGLDPEQVVAGKLFEAGRTPVLALAAAGRRVRAADVALAAGDEDVAPATSARVREHTGFLPGWLPPVAHERPTRALIDETLAAKDVLYAAGGDTGVMLVIRASDLLRATSGTLAALSTIPARPAPDPGSVAAPGTSRLAG